LNQFEIAQIIYLRPERVEVAVALIPRLVKNPQYIPMRIVCRPSFD